MFPIPYLGQTIDNAHSSWAGKRNGCGGEPPFPGPIHAWEIHHRDFVVLLS